MKVYKIPSSFSMPLLHPPPSSLAPSSPSLPPPSSPFTVPISPSTVVSRRPGKRKGVMPTFSGPWVGSSMQGCSEKSCLSYPHPQAPWPLPTPRTHFLTELPLTEVSDAPVITGFTVGNHGSPGVTFGSCPFTRLGLSFPT